MPDICVVVVMPISLSVYLAGGGALGVESQRVADLIRLIRLRRVRSGAHGRRSVRTGGGEDTGTTPWQIRSGKTAGVPPPQRTLGGAGHSHPLVRLVGLQRRIHLRHHWRQHRGSRSREHEYYAVCGSRRTDHIWVGDAHR